MRKRIAGILLAILGVTCSDYAQAQVLLVDSLGTGPVYDSIMGPNAFSNLRFSSGFNIDLHQHTGRLAVVWAEPDAGGFNDVWCAIYDKDFVMIDTAFRINNTDDGDQVDPYVLFNQNDLNGNGLVAAWSGTGNGTTYDIYMKKIDAGNSPSGATQAPDVLANDTVTYSYRQMTPVLAIDHGRNQLIVAWRDLDGQADGSSYGAVARVFDFTTLAPLDDEFVINSTTTGLQALSHIVYSPISDELLTVCQSANASGSYPSNYQVTFRAFLRDANDSLVGGTETIVNGNQNYHHQNPKITLNRSNGNYIVGWHSSNLDGSGEGSYSRVFDKEHTEMVAQFRVNTSATDNQLSTNAIWDEATGKVVYFYYFGSSTNQTIRYQHYDKDFASVGAEGEALVNPDDSTTVVTVRYKGYFGTLYDQNRRKAYLAYNLYNGTSGAYSKGFVRRLSYQVMEPKQVYARLEDRLSGSCHLSRDGMLSFQYLERYSVDDGDTLNYRIMDQNHADASPATVLTKNYGVNWYTLNLNGTLTDGEYYILEVRNDKGDLYKLRFRHEE